MAEQQRNTLPLPFMQSILAYPRQQRSRSLQKQCDEGFHPLTRDRRYGQPSGHRVPITLSTDNYRVLARYFVRIAKPQDDVGTVQRRARPVHADRFDDVRCRLSQTRGIGEKKSCAAKRCGHFDAIARRTRDVDHTASMMLRAARSAGQCGYPQLNCHQHVKIPR